MPSLRLQQALTAAKKANVAAAAALKIAKADLIVAEVTHG